MAAEDEKSTGEKLLGAAIVKEMNDDSGAKKLIKLKAAGDIVTDEGDSVLKKAIRLKVMDEATEK